MVRFSPLACEFSAQYVPLPRSLIGLYIPTSMMVASGYLLARLAALVLHDCSELQQLGADLKPRLGSGIEVDVEAYSLLFECKLNHAARRCKMGHLSDREHK